MKRYLQTVHNHLLPNKYLRLKHSRVAYTWQRIKNLKYLDNIFTDISTKWNKNLTYPSPSIIMWSSMSQVNNIIWYTSGRIPCRQQSISNVLSFFEENFVVGEIICTRSPPTTLLKREMHTKNRSQN